MRHSTPTQRFTRPGYGPRVSLRIAAASQLATIIPVLLAGLTVGCSTGADLRVRPDPYEVGTGSRYTLSVPDQQAFTIVETSQDYGDALGGDSDAQATVDATGAARCIATASSGADATSRFQIGAALRNAGAEQIAGKLTTKFTGTLTTSVEPQVDIPDASITLDLIIRNRRTLGSRVLPLLSGQTDNGNVRRQLTEAYEKAIVIPSGDTLDVYLVGTATVASGATRSARAELKIDDIQFTFDLSPASSAVDRDVSLAHHPAAPTR